MRMEAAAWKRREASDVSVPMEPVGFAVNTGTAVK